VAAPLVALALIGGRMAVRALAKLPKGAKVISKHTTRKAAEKARSVKEKAKKIDKRIGKMVRVDDEKPPIQYSIYSALGAGAAGAAGATARALSPKPKPKKKNAKAKGGLVRKAKRSEK
jgi:hypothetical protein